MTIGKTDEEPRLGRAVSPLRTVLLCTASALAVGLVVGFTAGSTGKGSADDDVQRAVPTMTVTLGERMPAPRPAATGPAPDDSQGGANSPVSTPATPSTGVMAGDGVYIVGSDVHPGTYRSTGSDNCYWARLKDATGGAGSILANHLASGPQLVTIVEGDFAFETTRCGSWAPV